MVLLYCTVRTVMGYRMHITSKLGSFASGWFAPLPAPGASYRTYLLRGPHCINLVHVIHTHSDSLCPLENHLTFILLVLYSHAVVAFPTRHHHEICIRFHSVNASDTH